MDYKRLVRWPAHLRHKMRLSAFSRAHSLKNFPFFLFWKFFLETANRARLNYFHARFLIVFGLIGVTCERLFFEKYDFQPILDKFLRIFISEISHTLKSRYHDIFEIVKAFLFKVINLFLVNEVYSVLTMESNKCPLAVLSATSRERVYIGNYLYFRSKLESVHFIRALKKYLKEKSAKGSR